MTFPQTHINGEVWDGAAVTDLENRIAAALAINVPPGSVSAAQQAAGNLSTAYTVDFGGVANKQIEVTGTLNANCTITLANRAAGCGATLLLTQDATGGRTLSISDGAASQAVQVPSTASGTFSIDVECPNPTDIYVRPTSSGPLPISVLTVTSTWKSVRAAVYGAKGDNATNDLAAIQAANSAAAADGTGVFFPPGTYLHSASLSPTTNWFFAPGATLKKTTTFSDTQALLVTAANITIANLTQDGNRSGGAAGQGVVWHAVGGTLIHPSTKHNTSTGVRCENGGSTLDIYDGYSGDNQSGSNTADGFYALSGGLLRLHGDCQAELNDRHGCFISNGAAQDCWVNGKFNSNNGTASCGVLIRESYGRSKHIEVRDNAAGGVAATYTTQVVAIGANATLAVTIGAGATHGSGGAAGGNPGTAGSGAGDTTVTGTGISVKAKGGPSGLGSAASSTTAVTAAAAYGSATRGLATTQGGAGLGGASGQTGGDPLGFSPGGAGGGGPATTTLGGGGGNVGTLIGAGTAGASGASGTAAGVNGVSGGAWGTATYGPGGGGGGGAAGTGAGGNGGDGSPGVVIIKAVG